MWEIYAYQNADSLFGIFNAAATIHGSGDYMAAVAAVAFCGFIAALVAYAFAPEKLQGWKWLATVLLVFSVLIVPRGDRGRRRQDRRMPPPCWATAPLHWGRGSSTSVGRSAGEVGPDDRAAGNLQTDPGSVVIHQPEGLAGHRGCGCHVVDGSQHQGGQGVSAQGRSCRSG
jgi:hypothetical protein